MSLGMISSWRACAPLHEALALAVAQDASLPSATLCDKAPRAVDAGGVELHKLQVLHQHQVTLMSKEVQLQVSRLLRPDNGDITGAQAEVWRLGGLQSWMAEQVSCPHHRLLAEALG